VAVHGGRLVVWLALSSSHRAAARGHNIYFDTTIDFGKVLQVHRTLNLLTFYNFGYGLYFAMNTNDIRQSVSEYAGSQHEMRRLALLVEAIASISNVATIQSTGGDAIYASGGRPSLNVLGPDEWDERNRGIERNWETIILTPFLAHPNIPCPGIAANGNNDNLPVVVCPIEKVSDLEIRIGSRIRRFADCTRSGFGFCQWRDGGYIAWRYTFDNFFPGVVVKINVRYQIPEERTASWDDQTKEGVAAIEAEVNPSNLTSEDLVGSVTFGNIDLFRQHYGSNLYTGGSY